MPAFVRTIVLILAVALAALPANADDLGDFAAAVERATAQF